MNTLQKPWKIDFYSEQLILPMFPNNFTIAFLHIPISISFAQNILFWNHITETFFSTMSSANFFVNVF